MKKLILIFTTATAISVVAQQTNQTGNPQPARPIVRRQLTDAEVLTRHHRAVYMHELAEAANRCPDTNALYHATLILKSATTNSAPAVSTSPASSTPTQ